MPKRSFCERRLLYLRRHEGPIIRLQAVAHVPGALPPPILERRAKDAPQRCISEHGIVQRDLERPPVQAMCPNVVGCGGKRPAGKEDLITTVTVEQSLYAMAEN